MPFGFGLFTTHFVPLVLGATAVVAGRFSAEQAVEMMERERVTVFVCVSTQFKMLLNSPDIRTRDLSALRIMFTGGEMIPFAAAAEFEDLTGATVLNFYGSNESGMATGTRLSHSREHRLRTGGTYLEGTEVRLFDEGVDVTSTGRGQPGSRGPAACLGYYDDPGANEELFTEDGFVLHADICVIDDEGFLVVVGRKSDIIIRGGKNISAAVVEDAVSAHPSVALASAVPMPDPLFGERVCVYVELRPGCELTLPELVAFLDELGMSKETFPEHLVIVDQIARSSGSKIAKGNLREDARIRAAELAASEANRTAGKRRATSERLIRACAPRRGTEHEDRSGGVVGSRGQVGGRGARSRSAVGARDPRRAGRVGSVSHGRPQRDRRRSPLPPDRRWP
jgi:acyl-CoA synthetase